MFGLFDVPAFVRRGLQIAAERTSLFQHCRMRRTERLGGVRVHLCCLVRETVGWHDLRDHLASHANLSSPPPGNTSLDSVGKIAWGAETDPIRQLERLAQELNVSGVAVARGTAIPRQIRRRLRELADSMSRFNRRWAHELDSVDVAAFNARVAELTRKYLIEKECSLRSARLATRGFRVEPPLTRAELYERFPLLPVLQFAGTPG